MLSDGEFFQASMDGQEPENDVAWHDGDLTDALNAILARRIIRVEQSGAKGWPDDSHDSRVLTTSPISSNVARTTLCLRISSGVEPARLAAGETGVARIPRNAGSHPFIFVCACCGFASVPSSGKDDAIPLVPAILQRAINGDGKAASELAARRLRRPARHRSLKTCPSAATPPGARRRRCFSHQLPGFPPPRTHDSQTTKPTKHMNLTHSKTNRACCSKPAARRFKARAFNPPASPTSAPPPTTA